MAISRRSGSNPEMITASGVSSDRFAAGVPGVHRVGAPRLRQLRVQPGAVGLADLLEAGRPAKSVDVHESGRRGSHVVDPRRNGRLPRVGAGHQPGAVSLAVLAHGKQGDGALEPGPAPHRGDPDDLLPVDEPPAWMGFSANHAFIEVFVDTPLDVAETRDALAIFNAVQAMPATRGQPAS